MKISEIALAVATEAHEGQTRWDGVTPYITHPIIVGQAAAEYCVTEKGAEITKSVGYLHDVLEDCEGYTEDVLREKLSEIPDEERELIIMGCRILNKNNYSSYLAYILNCGTYKDFRPVKIEDIRHNLKNLKKGSMKDKYELALHVLENFS